MIGVDLLYAVYLRKQYSDPNNQVNNCKKELEEMKHMTEFLDPSEGRAEVFQEVCPFTVE